MDTTTNTTPLEPTAFLMPRSDFDHHTTEPQNNTRARSLGFLAGALAAPLAVGAGIALLSRHQRESAITRARIDGLIAGAGVALAAGLVRWQFQRWFTPEPAYTVEQRIGDLEIRNYEPRVEAHTRFATLDFDEVRERGFRRLAKYIFGGNAAHRSLPMTTPVTITPRAGTHTVAFVMPPGESKENLPHPDDSRVDVLNIPARRVAVLCYRGGYNAATVGKQSERLRELCRDAGLTTRGEPMFAGFDPPSTLPFLRRTEVWIELA